MKHRITLTTEEIEVVAHILDHFTDYMCGDDRPDHGMGILKQYRETNMRFQIEEKLPHIRAVFSAMGKFYRFRRKLRTEYAKKLDE
jgi:hypothetical protein